LEELLSSNNQLLKHIKFSPFKTLDKHQKTCQFFCQANVARNKLIIAKQAEITAWCLFSERFEDKVVELRSNDKKLTKLYLTGVFDRYLRVMTCKVRKINKLFGYEYDLVTLKKIDGITGYMV
jgi:hypothetical protein